MAVALLGTALAISVVGCSAKDDAENRAVHEGTSDSQTASSPESESTVAASCDEASTYGDRSKKPSLSMESNADGTQHLTQLYLYAQDGEPVYFECLRVEFDIAVAPGWSPNDYMQIPGPFSWKHAAGSDSEMTQQLYMYDEASPDFNAVTKNLVGDIRTAPDGIRYKRPDLEAPGAENLFSLYRTIDDDWYMWCVTAGATADEKSNLEDMCMSVQNVTVTNLGRMDLGRIDQGDPSTSNGRTSTTLDLSQGDEENIPSQLRDMFYVAVKNDPAAMFTLENNYGISEDLVAWPNIVISRWVVDDSTGTATVDAYTKIPSTDTFTFTEVFSTSTGPQG